MVSVSAVKRSTIGILLSFSLVGSVAPAHASMTSSGCSALERATTGCPTTSGVINGSGVDVSAHEDSPGRTGGSDAEDAGGDADDASSEPVGDVIPPANRVPHEQYGVICGPPACVADAPAVHLSDLASFHPARPGSVDEPNGWAVAGLDTNFVANAPPQVLNGTLLGHRAQVRFTASRYRWSYGDGAARITGDPGAAWAQLGVPEFSPTATSHIYRNRGTFSAQLTVGYSPEYRFGSGPWTPITGLLDLSGARITVIVGDADTVLVGGDCLHNPRGPGC